MTDFVMAQDAGLCFGIMLCLVVVMSISCGGGEAPPVRYTSAIETDPVTGWHVVRLTAEHGDDSRNNLSIAVTPEGGSNMFSLTVGGHEMLVAADSLAKFMQRSLGTFVMYPAPNRTTDGVYRFMGESYSLAFPGQTHLHSSHGLVRFDTNWSFTEPVITDAGISFTTSYVFDEDNPRFAAYPFKNTLTLTFTVMADRVRVGYEVENQDTKPLGFGFGLHPFWRIHGDRAEVRVQADLPWHMDAVNMYPTGRLDATAESRWSLAEPAALSQLSLDDVYFGATPQSEVNVFFDALGIQLAQRATDDFTHVVVYTPDTEFVCVENQTCSTDAFNLHAQGFEEQAHLQILPAGEKTGGHVDYLFTWNE